MSTYSEPLKEIVGKPAEVKELYLAKKGFDTLHDFDKFINLEVLWLNNNLLTSVINLDACTRIRKLYLQDNKITTLTGSIEKFRFLEVLLLHNNLLRDLQSVLDHLIHLSHLKQLNLLGNPCAEEEDYREIVISRLPLLEIFDRHVVTAKERAAADKKLKIAPQLFRSPSDLSITKKSKPKTKTEMLLELEAQRIRETTLAREQTQKQQQREAEAQAAASKERAPSNFLPLPDALDFLKKKQQSSPNSTFSSSFSSSSSSSFTLPPLPPSSTSSSSTSSSTKRSRSKKNTPRTPPSSRPLEKSPSLGSFKFETFIYPKTNPVPIVEEEQQEVPKDGALKTRMKPKITNQQTLNKDYTEKKKMISSYKQTIVL